MRLNLVETNLEKVKPELHAFYVKQSDGKFKLALNDLDSHVESHVKPLKSELAIAHENERKLSLSAALHKANIDPHYEALVIANIGKQVALETVDNKRVVRIRASTGGMPMVGSGADGLATLDDLVKEAVGTFPSAFKGKKPGDGGTPAPGTGTLTVSEFRALSPIEQRQKVFVEKYKIVDDPKPRRIDPKPGEKVLTRAQFSELSPADQRQKVFVEKYKVVD